MTKKTSDDIPDTAESPDAVTSGGKKGAPTPKRSEQVAANKRPLVPNDRKEARQRARAQMADQRERARIGMANGDERYLPERDRGPQKRYVRDWVDARTSLSEFMLPFMFLVIVATFIPIPQIQVYGMFALWVFFFIMVIECIFAGLRVRKLLREKFGETRVERGVRWYAAMRMIQLRKLRLPKPQSARGEYPR
ncbi:DUF3043 domain-containing protein [Microbacterium sp. MPKO10]|uniref:DUF3043 domain-containing protein n=1 Tax=Microbacterium sp. MPKO10 TaxID=2989818 RepID=UPI0022357CAF|nr:DUF3043 domain-containing protein [Microbacterium sp. MPKO10]MCW4459419.1 DUF3043 domain-containing protein [Microbacterium sp. MPKO10]